MRKFLNCLFAILIFVIATFSIFPQNIAFAENLNQQSQEIDIEELAIEFGEQFKDRRPGFEGEKNAADYIKSKLDSISTNRFFAVNSSSTIDGVQKFNFRSIYDDRNHNSQNLIYFYKSNVETEKKIIIGCNYDSIAFDYNKETYETKIIDSESLNGSAASVALLISFAQMMQSIDLPYNIEFIFFGAGESNNAGSEFYASGLLPKVKENILCMINLDNIAVGENLYFYNDEIETKFENFVVRNLKDNNQKMKKVNIVNLGKISMENKLGLQYSHIALQSDNINFMKEGVPTLNIFAGDYEEGIVSGRCEFDGKDVITYTKNDNVDYIKANYGNDSIKNNLDIVKSSILSIIQDESFVNECTSARENTKTFYSIFANQKLVVYITIIAFIIIVIVVSYLKMKLSIKSYDANLEEGFLNSVISISSNIDETCSTEEVPKTVSKLIAKDIKKDKMIKPKKKK